MTHAAQAPEAAAPARAGAWLALGALSGVLLGIPATVAVLPDAPLDHAADLHAALANPSRAVLLALWAAAATGLAIGAAAIRRRAAGSWAAGFAGGATLAATLLGWAHLEARERSAIDRTIAGQERMLAESLRRQLDVRFAAVGQLARSTARPRSDEWASAAQSLSVDFPAVRWVAAVTVGDGRATAGRAVPDDAQARSAEAAAAISTMADGLERSGRATALAPDGRTFMVGAAGPDGAAVAAIDVPALVAAASEALEPGLEASAEVAGATAGPAPGAPSTSFAVEQHAWHVRVAPAASWVEAHRHAANAAFLATGCAAAALATAAAQLSLAALRARRAARRATHEAAAARARARIAQHARDALSQEAGHVIRARIRETARALDAATDPRADAPTRTGALRRIGTSLTQAEAEVSALLDPSPQTRLARAEHDATLELHFATAVLEFAGGTQVRLDVPVPHGALAQVQRDLGAQAFAVITSDNPASAPDSPQANMLRRGVLGLELRNAGLVHVPATGRSPDGAWSEQGFAVAMSPSEADALAELHAQRAYFWFDGTAFAIHETIGERRTIALPRPQDMR
jgi:SWI/SNF-related matrix-associated actin-dependent regulator 1 of chromatin subfamily A